MLESAVIVLITILLAEQAVHEAEAHTPET